MKLELSNENCKTGSMLCVELYTIYDSGGYRRTTNDRAVEKSKRVSKFISSQWDVLSTVEHFVRVCLEQFEETHDYLEDDVPRNIFLHVYSSKVA